MAKERVVFLKLSGELFGIGNPSNLGINPEALKAVAQKVSIAFKGIKDLGYTGLVVVPGAGNLVRGDRFISAGIAVKAADRDGRLSTMVNSDLLSAALTDLKVPNKFMTAASILYADSAFKPQQYSAHLAQDAIRTGQVIIIGGGNGEDNATTDNAVAYYANDYAHNKAEVVVLKGTKYDGVFSADPSKNPKAKKIKIIGAPTMLANYEKYSVIDKPSLQRLVDGRLSMLVYKDELHEVAEVLKHSPLETGIKAIGTAIIPLEKEPEFY